MNVATTPTDSVPEQYDPFKLKLCIVNTFCASCGPYSDKGDEPWSLGQIINAFAKVTGSRYMPIVSRKLDETTVSLGSQLAANNGTALEGCVLQTIFCGRATCKVKLGFYCVLAPDKKAQYRYRQFLQLDKVILRSHLTGAVVQPIEGDEHITRDGYIKPQPLATPQPVLGAPASRPSDVLRDGVFTTADEAAVEGTNNGTMTWKDAHARWLESTQRELSPSSFGSRIMALGGGKRPKSFVASPVPPAIASSTSSVVTTREPSQPQGTPMPKPPVPVSVNANNQRFAVPGAGPAAQNPQPISQVRPSPNASGASNQDSLEKQRQDITQIQIAMQNLGSTVTNLANQVASLIREGGRLPTTQSASEDTPLELLMDNLSNVMTKAAQIDSLKMQVDLLQRRMKRLENGQGSTYQGSPAESLHQQGPSNSTPQPSMAIPGGIIAPNVQTSVSTSPTAWQAGNNLKRTLPENTELQPNAKRQKQDDLAATNPYFPSQSGPLAASQMSSQPQAHQFEQVKRPRGRPRKNRVPDFSSCLPDLSFSASQTPQPQWPQSVAGNPFNDVSPSFGADYVDDRGQVVRRGGGAWNTYMSPDGRKGRTRPIRNDEGVLIRKDGKPDRRSMTSAENLRRTMLRKQEEAKELGFDSAWDARRSRTASGKFAPEGPPQLVVLDDDDDSTHSSVDDALAAWEKRAGPGSPSGWTRKPDQAAASTMDASGPADAHSDVMRKMFPQGMSEAARSLDFSSQLFRTDTPVATLSEKPLARMTVRSEIGGATAPPTTTSNTATATSAATTDAALPPADVNSAPASAVTEPAVSPDGEDEAMPDVINDADESDGDYQEPSQDSSADASSIELLVADDTPTVPVQKLAQDVRDPSQHPANANNTAIKPQAPPRGTIPTADQGTRVTLTEASEILGVQFFACPVAMAIMNSQSVSREALQIMRQIFETSDPAARTDMAAFMSAWVAGGARQAINIHNSRNTGKGFAEGHTSLAKATRAAIENPEARNAPVATINLARTVLGDRFFICPVARRIMATQSVSKEAFVVLRQIFEKHPKVMNDITVLSQILEGADKRAAAEAAANQPVVEAIASANAAYEATGSIITGVASLNFAARGILGEPFYYSEVAIVFIKEAKSLPRETIVLMRSIFEKDPAARKDMKLFLKHLEAGGAGLDQVVQDQPNEKNEAAAAAADQDLTDTHTVLVMLTKEARAAIASPASSAGSIAISNLAKEILGTPFSISPVAQRILRSQTLPKEAIVMMKSIFDMDLVARSDMKAFLSRLQSEMAKNVRNDPEVLDAIATANAAYEAVRPRASKGPVITGTELQSAAREILEEHYECLVAQDFLRIRSSLSREELVKMRTIFDKDPATRNDFNAFLKQFGKKDESAAAGGGGDVPKTN